MQSYRYDHRGLVLATRHQFWQVDWANSADAVWQDGATFDPATPDLPRDHASLAYLSLPELADTAGITVASTYDAAGRPLEVTYPEGMRVRASYAASGQLTAVEADRGAGYTTIADQFRYDARLASDLRPVDAPAYRLASNVPVPLYALNDATNSPPWIVPVHQASLA